MTDLTTVTIAGVSVNGDPLPAGRRVEIALIAGTAGGSVDGVAIVERWTVKLDAEGEGTIDLYPTSAIEPAGSYYAFTVDNTTPVIVRCITVPDSGPVSWVDEAIQVDNPSPPVTVPLPTSGDPLQVLRVNAEGSEYELADLDDQTLTVDVLIEDIDLAGGSFTHVTPYGSPDPVPRAYFAGLTALPVTGSDIGYLWTLTATGACTQGRALAPGDVVSAGYFQGQTAVAVGTSAVTGIFVQATEDYVDTAAASAEAAAVAGAAGATDRAVALSQIVGDQTYLKVGHDGTGSPSLDEGAFSCGTDLNFTSGVDVRVWGRLMRTEGTSSYSKWVTQNVDALVGTVEAYELAPFQNSDDDLVWFSEHIKTGQTVEQDPKPVTAAGLPQNPALGVIVGIRHTIDFTGGPGGVGVEKFWVPSDDPDVVTADGIGWKTIATLTHAGPESIKTSYTEPFHIGMSQHESHIFVVQMFNGIDGTCLVDLHAADATSATTITCRQGTVWTAAGSQAEIVNYGSGGGTVDVVSNVASGRILGRTTAGPGDSEELTPSAVKTALAIDATDVSGLPWLSNWETLPVIGPPNSSSGTGTNWTPTASAIIGSGFANPGSTGTQVWTYKGIPLLAGTWAAHIGYRKTSTAGIVDYTLGGVSLGAGVDHYAGSNSGDNRVIVTGITISSNVLADLVISSSTKNASSGGYAFFHQFIRLYRTGP